MRWNVSFEEGDGPPERSLDPADWEEFRALGHRVVDDLTAMLAGIREQPVWNPVPQAMREAFAAPAPREGADPARVYQEVRERILPYPLGNIHPRHWGWVMGTGTPVSILADLIAAASNSNCPGFANAATLVEQQAIAWLAEAIGFPAGASGLFVSSGSMANLTALAVARTARAGYDVREEGVRGGSCRLVVYCSTETHSSIQKAAELLGIGRAGLRYLPVNQAFEIDVGALERAIVADREAGLRPFCVVGTAGTVNTGAVDDLVALAGICRRHELWFHVDGAFGALAALSPALRGRVAGLDLADSIIFCQHKWMYLNYDCSTVLVRDPAAHRAAFELTPSYLAPSGRGIAPGPLLFSHLGIDLSRGFRALKVWMALKAHGLDTYGEMIAQNVAQARYLGTLVAAHPRLECLAPIALNIVCFRYRRPGLDDPRLNQLNSEILMRLQERGIAAPSGTVLHGRFAIRVANTNHRTRRSDLRELVAGVLHLGDEIAEAG
jgi:glutamate/tyrosine decarboxylase-like PLP-dependent enzyme